MCRLLVLSVTNRLLPIGQEPKLAFEDVDATELYPCVMFYSSNPGEKVRRRPPPETRRSVGAHQITGSICKNYSYLLVF